MTLKQKYTLLFVLGALSAIGPFSIDMYLPAFPSIADGLNTDISNVSLSITSYFIGISIGQLIYGPITDKYGRKKPLLIGLTLFCVTALACVFSPSINWLIGMRFLLALGGCAGLVTSKAVVRDAFHINETAKIFSMLMLISGVAPIIAPTIGGWLLNVFNWHSIFYFLSIFSFILILAVHFFLPEGNSKNKERSLKPKEIYKDYKIVFSNPHFLYYTLASGTGMAGMFAYISGSAFVFIKHFGISESNFGLIFGLNACGFILGSQINRLLLKKYTSQQIITFAATTLICISILILLLFTVNAITSIILVGFIFTFLFSLGLLIPNATALALAPFSKNAGSASALIGFIQMFFGASLTAMVSLLHNETIFPLIFGMFLCGITTFCIIMIRNTKVKKEKLYKECIS